MGFQFSSRARTFAVVAWCSNVYGDVVFLEFVKTLFPLHQKQLEIPSASRIHDQSGILKLNVLIRYSVESL